METKKAIRKEVARRRKEAAQDYLNRASESIADKVITLEEFKEASCIYTYIDYNHEVQTDKIIEEAWKQGKLVAVPRVEGKNMTFYILDSFDQLEEGYFGIPEPKEGVPANCPDALMIMPGVAFSPDLCRVGYGGGFYDRYLETHTEHKKVAIAFEFQMMEEVPCEPTDIFPDKIVTEKTIYC